MVEIKQNRHKIKKELNNETTTKVQKYKKQQIQDYKNTCWIKYFDLITNINITI